MWTIDEPMEMLTAVLAAATILLVLVAVAQAFFTGRTIKTLKHVERAFIFINNKSENISDAIRPGILYPNSPTMGHRGEISVSYEMKNYGRTPAVLQDISHKVICSKLSHMPNYPSLNNNLVEQAVAAGAIVAAPECHLETPLNMQDAIDIAGGKSTLWFYGRVKYDDAFGSPHEHRFLHRYSGGMLRPHFVKRYSRNT